MSLHPLAGAQLEARILELEAENARLRDDRLVLRYAVAAYMHLSSREEQEAASKLTRALVMAGGMDRERAREAAARIMADGPPDEGAIRQPAKVHRIDESEPTGGVA